MKSDKPETILIRAREKKGMTQNQLGEAIGVGLRQIQNYETGKFPKYKKEPIYLIDSILGTNIGELIYEKKIHFNNEKPEVEADEEIALIAIVDVILEEIAKLKADKENRPIKDVLQELNDSTNLRAIQLAKHLSS